MSYTDLVVSRLVALAAGESVSLRRRQRWRLRRAIGRGRSPVRR